MDANKIEQEQKKTAASKALKALLIFLAVVCLLALAINMAAAGWPPSIH